MQLWESKKYQKLMLFHSEKIMNQIQDEDFREKHKEEES